MTHVSLAKKMGQVVLLALCMVCLVALNVYAATPVNMRTVSPVMVNGDMIRLSDLFDGVPAESDQGIARAPQAGNSVVFDRALLATLAERFDFDLAPLPATAKLMVSKPVDRVKVSLEDIQSLLSLELTAQGYGDTIEVVLDRASSDLYQSTSGNGRLDVSGLKFDVATGRFSAQLRPDSDMTRVTEVAGRAYVMVDVPVLNRKVDKGNIIRASDISMVTRRQSDINAGVVTHADALVGKTPRRFVLENTPVRTDAVESPALVHKGKQVLVTYRTDSVTITMRGKCMQDGALGDVVRVINTESNSPLDATVVGEGRVDIGGRSRHAAEMLIN